MRVRAVLLLAGGAAAWHDVNLNPSCTDTPPSQQYTCEQQKSWGKCSEVWMVGYCCKTCFECMPGCGATPPAPYTPSPPAAPYPPVDPELIDSGRQVLSYLYSLTGNGTLTGQVEKDHYVPGGTVTPVRTDWDKVGNITGKHPAVYGNQFLWGDDSWTHTMRQAWVDRSKVLWHGEVVNGTKLAHTLTHVNFHVCPPYEKFRVRNCTWNDIAGSHLNATLIDQILKNGTVENEIWLKQIDTFSKYFRDLQSSGVPVLWRPFHEMNGGWFWWGQTPRFTELWVQLFDRMTKVNGLHNLIWVFGANGGHGPSDKIEKYYPGHAYVDVLGEDIYVSHGGSFSEDSYNSLTALADGRVISLTEVGHIPNATLLRSHQKRYVWFLTWGSFEVSQNTAEHLTSVYNDPWFKTQGEVQL